MQIILALALATTLAGMLSACGVTYEERTAYRPDPAYYPMPYNGGERVYTSRYDYYRHYNGIDG